MNGHDDQTCPTDWCQPDTTGGDVLHASDWEGVMDEDDMGVLARAEVTSAGPRVMLAIHGEDGERLVPLSLTQAQSLRGLAREMADLADSAPAGRGV